MALLTQLAQALREGGADQVDAALVVRHGPWLPKPAEFGGVLRKLIAETMGTKLILIYYFAAPGGGFSINTANTVNIAPVPVYQIPFLLFLKMLMNIPKSTPITPNRKITQNTQI